MQKELVKLKIKEKKKILVISDSPLAPSGVGTQTKYMIESMLSTGKYKFLCMAGAIKHNDYSVKRVQPWGDDWVIKPVDGYGTHDVVRSLIRDYKPDVLWFMTDPRFYHWLWEIENEIRPNVPMVYYHVWDNYPYPKFNKMFYDSNDVICTISKVTDDIVKNVAPGTKCVRIQHAVDTSIFNKKSDSERKQTREAILNSKKDKTIFFWNNRNARRKQSGTLIFWFKEFLDKIGKDKACLLMHTDPTDPHGQDLNAIIQELGLTNGEVKFSTMKISPQDLSSIYSAVDCTINISDAEGFGLSTLESLSCETPIIVNMTGGLQEQVTDGNKWFGIGIQPASRAIIGSQEVPYIYEDRISKEDFLSSMEKFYNFSKKQRQDLGTLGRQHVLTNYNLEKYQNNWEALFDMVTEEFGSWEGRKKYNGWEIREIT